MTDYERLKREYDLSLLGKNAAALSSLSGIMTDAQSAISALQAMFPVSVANGGTGASTAAAALTALGLPYETGSWTPTGGRCTVSSVSSNVYTRIGNMVHIRARFYITKGSTASDNPIIYGLPFVSSGQANWITLRFTETMPRSDYQGFALLANQDSNYMSLWGCYQGKYYLWTNSTIGVTDPMYTNIDGWYRTSAA